MKEDIADCPVRGIGEIIKETVHIPSKQEELDWRKEQLKKFFGKQYDKLFKEAKDFFRSRMGFMIKNRYTRGNVTFYPTSKEVIERRRNAN